MYMLNLCTSQRQSRKTCCILNTTETSYKWCSCYCCYLKLECKRTLIESYYPKHAEVWFGANCTPKPTPEPGVWFTTFLEPNFGMPTNNIYRTEFWPNHSWHFTPQILQLNLCYCKPTINNWQLHLPVPLVAGVSHHNTNLVTILVLIMRQILHTLNVAEI